jgi:hypothetical protein
MEQPVPADSFLTRFQVLRELGITRSTLLEWRKSCGPLESQPFQPAGLRTRHGCRWPDEEYSAALVEKIKSAWKCADEGFYLDNAGRGLIAAWKFLELLKAEDVQPTMCERTIDEWCSERGCVHLPGRARLQRFLLKLDRGKGGATCWHLRSDADTIIRSIKDRNCRIVGPDVTVTGAAREAKVTPATIYRWEKEGLFGDHRLGENRGGSAGRPKKIFDATKAKAISDAVKKSRETKVTGYFDANTRIDVKRLAKALCLPLWCLRRVLPQWPKELIADLQPEVKKRPDRKGISLTFLASGIGKLKEHWRARDAEFKSLGADWKTREEIAREHKTRFSAVCRTVRAWEAVGLLTVKRANYGRLLKCNSREIAKLLDGRNFSEVDLTTVATCQVMPSVTHDPGHETVTSADNPFSIPALFNGYTPHGREIHREETMRCVREAFLGLGAPEAITPSHAKPLVKRKAGRKQSPEVEKVYHACYVACTSGRKRAIGLLSIQKDLGNRAVKDESTMWKYAVRYAKRNDLPIEKTPEKQARTK